MKIVKKVRNYFRNKADSVRQKFSSSLRKNKKVASSQKKTELRKPTQITVEESKYSSTPRGVPEHKPMRRDLPWSYDEDKIVLQVRDPWWVHSYWEVTQQTKNKLKGSFGPEYDQASWALRVYDVSFIIFNGDNAHSYFDIVINQEAINWYINVTGGRSFCVDLGLKLRDGRFITVVRSNIVTTPTDGPSWITDEEWFIPEDLFYRLYGLSFGLGSSPVKGIKEAKQQRFVSSPGLASMASPVKIPQPMRNFWLVVNTELIVYGATEPDAKVTVQGKAIKLNKDGTFALRFALPDGKQVIPVRAESQDGIDVRTITPIVTKESK
jgi:hypothetical protein